MVRVYMCMCHVCVRMCTRVCVRVCMHACVHVFTQAGVHKRYGVYPWKSFAHKVHVPSIVRCRAFLYTGIL